jgi:hypothetical protein
MDLRTAKALHHLDMKYGHIGVAEETQHVLAGVDDLTSRGIEFRSLTEGLHTEGPMGTAMLTIMAAFAQLERDTMIERTRAGLAAAAANGRKGGRPRKVDDADARLATVLPAESSEIELHLLDQRWAVLGLVPQLVPPPWQGRHLEPRRSPVRRRRATPC